MPVISLQMFMKKSYPISKGLHLDEEIEPLVLQGVALLGDRSKLDAVVQS